MEFIENIRKLISETGFIRHKETGAVYNYSIYIGKYDKVENYEECSANDYEAYLKLVRAQEEEFEKQQQESENIVEEEPVEE